MDLLLISYRQILFSGIFLCFTYQWDSGQDSLLVY